MEEYIKFGEELPQKNIEALQINKAKEIFRACSSNNSFSVVELRIQNDGNYTNEIIVVDCLNDCIPTQNKIGIQYKERLALIFSSDDSKIPEVRPLRKNFPDTIHQNLVLDGEPKSLCLYSEKWSSVERYWTAQNHLQRICKWLERVALDTLHESDQPVESIYFDTGYKVILPSNFKEEILKNDQPITLIRVPNKSKKMVFRGEFIKKEVENISFACIVLTLAPQVHGKIKKYPLTLGELNDQLRDNDINFIELVRGKTKELISDYKSEKSHLEIYKNHVFLILDIPIQRNENSAVERNEVRGFIIKTNVVELAQNFGDVAILDGTAGIIIDSHLSTDWPETLICPIDINFDFNRCMAQEMSGIEPSDPSDVNFSGTIIGVGALGSSLINIWARCGWGIWTLIDNDYLYPPNLARHLGFNAQIGKYKADAVKEIIQCIYNDKTHNLTSICDDFYSNKNDDIKNIVSSTDLIIDASATVEIARDLSILQNRGRAASVFFTPSGLSAVMLFEDSLKEISLDILELQYYRAIIKKPWGEMHLNTTNQLIRVGSGCSDLSLKLSNEYVQLHSATIARHLRLQHKKQEAKIQIWQVDPETGGIVTDIINPSNPIISQNKGWRIVWDNDTKEKIRELRKLMLPNETGGVLLGYIDQKIKSIYIVDALPEPRDSLSDKQGFIRGIDHVQDAVHSAQQRTNGVVTYIGEWHSHPVGVSANPSKLDNELLSELADELFVEGQPGIILIVSETTENWVVKDLNDESN